MTANASSDGDATRNEPSHHSDGGRNVIAAHTSTDGSDIFHAAVQMSRMPMCLTDPNQPDDPIVFCNRAFEHLTGYDRSEVLGRNCRMLQGEGTDRETVAQIRRTLDAGQDVHRELLNYRKDGTPFWNALFISPVSDPGGAIRYRFASQLDVTRRREAELVLQQSQRMETLGGMATGLAHQFNNLMTIVLSSLERLASADVADRRARQIERARWGATSAARLTDQMLAFARRPFHDRTVFDASAMVANFDSILAQMAGPTVRLVLSLSDEPLPVELDAGQLELALLNLVRNAAEAMPKGGEVVIATRAVSSPDGRLAEITVRDDGIGMEAAVARRILEPFFTTKGPGRGTGLGLSMVNGFAVQAEGNLSFETAPGAGTTMRLRFPSPEAGGPGGPGS